MIAQDFPVDSLTGKVIYKEVVKVEGDEDVLYKRGKEYFVNSYKSSNEVIQLDDIESKIIIGKAYKDIFYDYGIPRLGRNKTKLKLFYSIKIDFKENKYRYTIYDFYTESYPTAQYSETQKYTLEEIFITNPNKPKRKKRILVRNGMVKSTKDSIENIINDLKSSMSKSKEKGDDNW